MADETSFEQKARAQLEAGFTGWLGGLASSFMSFFGTIALIATGIGFLMAFDKDGQQSLIDLLKDFTAFGYPIGEWILGGIGYVHEALGTSDASSPLAAYTAKLRSGFAQSAIEDGLSQSIGDKDTSKRIASQIASNPADVKFFQDLDASLKKSGKTSESPEFLHAVIKNRPHIANEVIRAMAEHPVADAKAAEKSRQTVLGLLKRPDLMKDLLGNVASRNVLLNAIENFSSKTGIQFEPGKLGNFAVKHGFDANGKITPVFEKVAANLLSAQPDKEAFFGQMAGLLTAKDASGNYIPAADVGEMFASIPQASLPEAMRPVVPLLKYPEALEAYRSFEEKAPNGTNALLALVSHPDPAVRSNGLLTIARNEQLRTATHGFLTALNTLPPQAFTPEVKKTIAEATDMLSTPEKAVQTAQTYAAVSSLNLTQSEIDGFKARINPNNPLSLVALMNESKLAPVFKDTGKPEHAALIATLKDSLGEAKDSPLMQFVLQPTQTVAGTVEHRNLEAAAMLAPTLAKLETKHEAPAVLALLNGLASGKPLDMHFIANLKLKPEEVTALASFLGKAENQKLLQDFLAKADLTSLGEKLAVLKDSATTKALVELLGKKDVVAFLSKPENLNYAEKLQAYREKHSFWSSDSRTQPLDTRAEKVAIPDALKEMPKELNALFADTAKEPRPISSYTVADYYYTGSDGKSLAAKGDFNGDGKADLSDEKALQTILATIPAAEQPKALAKLDGNGNGIITASEIADILALMRDNTATKDLAGLKGTPSSQAVLNVFAQNVPNLFKDEAKGPAV